MLNQWFKLALLAFVGIIVASLAVGAISGFDNTLAPTPGIQGINSGLSTDHNPAAGGNHSPGGQWGPGYAPGPGTQNNYQQSPDMQMNMQDKQNNNMGGMMMGKMKGMM